MIYSKKDGDDVVRFLQVEFKISSTLIGSLAKTGGSNHDIDILLECEKTKDLLCDLILKLSPHGVDETDWGGWYFSRTIFGDIDFFFEYPDGEKLKGLTTDLICD